MDMETRRDMETMAEWAATQDAWDRLLERRARRRRFLAFCFNWRQVVDSPDVPVPASGAKNTAQCAPTPGAGTRAAGFRDVTPTNTLTPLASGSRLPGGPPHR